MKNERTGQPPVIETLEKNIEALKEIVSNQTRTIVTQKRTIEAMESGRPTLFDEMKPVNKYVN